MSVKVCLGANTLGLLEAGGHLWVHLNWALGLRSLGCDLVWLEQVNADANTNELSEKVATLKRHLAPFGLSQSVALCHAPEKEIPAGTIDGCLDVNDVYESDMLLNVANKIGEPHVRRFRRSALLDIDPGILQIWISESRQPLTPHDVYFTIGETVGTPNARFPDCGVDWQYTPAAVCLSQWEPAAANGDAPYTTVSSWWGWWEEFAGETFNNEKRTTFLEYLDLPFRTSAKFELALALWEHREHDDVRLLADHGWQVQHAFDVASTPDDYRDYVKRSRGEFSCAKPSCMRLQNAWISDRTLCYLATGKPAVVQHTGPSRFLPDASGLFRFRNMDEAVRMIETAEADYEHQGREARAFVEEYFDARKVAARVLERALS